MAAPAPPVPLFSTPPAAQSMLPTEIISRVFQALMDSYSSAPRDGRLLNTIFDSWSAACPLFRAIAKGNGHRSAYTSEELVDTLVAMAQDPSMVAGMTRLGLAGVGPTDFVIIRKILRLLAGSPKFKHLRLKINSINPEREGYEEEIVLVMTALEGLENLETLEGEWTRAQNGAALCRCLLRWPKLQRLEIDETRSDDVYEGGSNLPPLLAQLSPTSLPVLKVLTLSINTPARLLILERILSYRQITHLDLICDLRSADEMDRVEAAIRGIAGRLKSLGFLDEEFREQSVLTFYPLLVRCEELSLQLFNSESTAVVPLPKPTQLPSLRTITAYGMTRDRLDLLKPFVLERKTPLETLRIDLNEEDYEDSDLWKVCDSVGTELSGA